MTSAAPVSVPNGQMDAAAHRAAILATQAHFGSTASTSRSDWIEQRRQQRASSSITVWASSPPPPKRRPSPEPRSKGASSRRRRSSDSSDSSDDSEADRKRRKHRSSRHSSSRREKSSRRSEKRASEEGEEELWVERPTAPSHALVRASSRPDEESDDEVGPMPAPEISEKPVDSREYGNNLLRGEGQAMAAYLADGQRIPRRGEIGMEADTIERFEKAGFVMSGSRNKKMETVRTRKENQVISAEEKRSLLKMQKEEKSKREQDIIASFKEMVDASLHPAPKARPA